MTLRWNYTSCPRRRSNPRHTVHRGSASLTRTRGQLLGLASSTVCVEGFRGELFLPVEGVGEDDLGFWVEADFSALPDEGFLRPAAPADPPALEAVPLGELAFPASFPDLVVFAEPWDFTAGVPLAWTVFGEPPF